MRRKLLLLIMALALPLLLQSCSTSGNDIKNTATTTETENTAALIPAPEETAPETTPAEATPALPSVPAGDFVMPVPGTRPIAVMIDNEGTRSLPQGGLNKAQVIYEVIVEGGETRLMPVFWNVDPEMIGPVRSSRDYFLDYSMEHDAIYVHYGWSPKAQKDIPLLHINNINGLFVGDVFWDLTKDKGNWQDSYTSMQKIQDYVKKVKYRTQTDKTPVFTYNQVFVEPGDGQSAVKISMRYSASYTCGYEYDASAKLYNRFRKGQPQMERVSGKQLRAANILIQYTHNNKIQGDKKDRQELDTTGSGSGWFITCGKAVKINWSKESRSAQTKYTDESGKGIVLNPGQTWVQVLPLTGKVTIE